MRDVKSASLEILKWELAKTWRLKLGTLEVVTRWHCFPYEKQRHLPVECFREFNWNKTDLANLDYRILQTFTDSRNDFPRLHACAVPLLSTQIRDFCYFLSPKIREFGGITVSWITEPATDSRLVLCISKYSVTCIY